MVPPGKSWFDPPVLEVIDLIDFSVPPFAEDFMRQPSLYLPLRHQSHILAKRVDSGTAAFHPGESRGGGGGGDSEGGAGANNGSGGGQQLPILWSSHS